MSLCVAFLISLCLFSCKKNEPAPDSKDTSDEKFVLIIDNKIDDGFNISHFASSVESGKLSIVQANESNIAGDLETVINGKTYGKGESVFAEYGINPTTNRLEILRKTPAALWLGTVTDIGNNRVISYKFDYFSDGKVPYQVFDIANMTLIKDGTFDLQVLPNHSAFPNSIIKRNNELLVTYMVTDNNTYASVDTAYIDIFNATDFSFKKRITDSRANSLGYNFMDDHFFDINGDLYISTSNSYYWGLNETQPSSIVRIKAGEDKFDTSYLFNITSKVGNEFSNGLFGIGNKKALTRVFKKSITADEYSKYSSGYSMETWEIDLNNNSAKKLEIPLSKFPHVNFLRLKNGKIAIPSNTANGNFIYIYNPTDGSIIKGLEYENGDVREVLEF